MSWPPSVHAEIAELLGQRTGWSIPETRLAAVERALRQAMGRHELQDMSEFLEGLRTARFSWDDLIEELAVSETYFFRDWTQFEVIRHQILPELLKNRPETQTLRAWSAGCASGEEAYSLAILLQEECRGVPARILGTDISLQALGKAVHGVYRDWSLRGEGEALAKKYLGEHPSGHRIDREIRSRVRFEVFNLAEPAEAQLPSHLQGMDLILCRNVLIYFDANTIRRVANRLFEALSENGWLLTAATDPPLAKFAPFKTVLTPAGIVYRRQSAHWKTPSLGTAARLALPPAPVRKPLQALLRSEPALPDTLQEFGVAPEPPPTARPLTEPAPDLVPLLPTPPARTDLQPVQAAWMRGDYQGVLDLTLAASDSASGILRLRALANLQGPEQALQTANELLKRHSLSAELHLCHASLLQAAHRDTAATDAIRRALYLDPSLAIAHFSLGSMLWRLGDLEGARRGYRNARDLCDARPQDEPVPLTEGESAGQVAQAAAAHLALLEHP